MENNHNPMEDDGSLDFLKIPADETNKHFNCPETTQQKSDARQDQDESGRPRPRRTQVLHQFAGNQICPRQDSGDGQIPATGNDAGIWNAVLLGVMDV